MTKRATVKRRKVSTVVPPLAVSVDEALTRLLKVKPPPRQKRDGQKRSDGR